MNKNSMPQKSFNFDFGTKPTTTSLDIIKVALDETIILKDFAKAYANELFRRNPAKAEEINLTASELQTYFTGIIAIRVKAIEGNCKDWRQAKLLAIPTWIQFVISQIGEVVDVERGLKFVPSFDREYDINELLDVSTRLSSFSNDGVTMHRDAFPRDNEGDVDLMSMAIIDGYVKSMSATAHPITSYISAFLGAKLEEEAAFKILYRVRYDDVEFIRTMLMHEESLI